MTAKTTALLAVPLTALFAGILGYFAFAPELLALIVPGATALILSSFAVLALWLMPSFENASLAWQRRLIWITALCATVIGVISAVIFSCSSDETPSLHDSRDCAARAPSVP